MVVIIGNGAFRHMVRNGKDFQEVATRTSFGLYVTSAVFSKEGNGLDAIILS